MNGSQKSPALVAASREAQYQILSDSHSIRTAFVNAMGAAGVTPSDPSNIRLDGTLQRFHVDGDKRGHLNGWAVLHLDGVPSGAYGSWKLGVSGTWCAKDHRSLSAEELEAVRQRVAAAKAERERCRERQYQGAKDRAKQLLRYSTPATPHHRYLQMKGIQPHCARQRGDQLVLRLVNFNRCTTSLQFIGPDGDKKLLKGGRKAGCFIPVAGKMPGASRILIAEGFATAATLAEAEPQAFVIAAVDAGNLTPVASGVRQRWPDVEIVICADADDVGRTKGKAAAIAAGALLAVPEFPLGTSGSDYNDLAALKLREVPRG